MESEGALSGRPAAVAGLRAASDVPPEGVQSPKSITLSERAVGGRRQRAVVVWEVSSSPNTSVNEAVPGLERSVRATGTATMGRKADLALRGTFEFGRAG